MSRRVLSLILCMSLFLTMAVPTARAAGDAVVCDSNNMVVVNADQTPEGEPDANDLDTNDPDVNDPDGTESGVVIPECDCGNTETDFTVHADGCAAKQYYKNVCAGTAEEIYAQWDSFSADGQAFILTYLSWTDQAKLDALNTLISEGGSGSEEPEEPTEPENPDVPVDPEKPVEDTATAPDGETQVSVSGIPADTKLQIAQTSTEIQASVKNFVQELGDNSARQLFIWDISLQNAEGAETQPDGNVRVELEVPDVTLHKYSTVYVVHVDDDGTASTINAEVTEDGNIAFYTNGFSTFAGFTVDFEYNGEAFSIPGETSIKLSEVFDQLKMPLYVSDVANVVFSDTTLVSVAKQEDGDWLLTSLQAFQTTETLTVTMNDGAIYEIKVTDAITTMADFYIAYMGGGAIPGYYIDGYTAGGNAQVQLFLDSDGHPSSNDSNVNHEYFVEQPLVVDGRGVGGCMEIILQKAEGASNNLVWDVTQFRIINGAKVVIRLGASFNGNETITIRSKKPYTNHDARQLFNIEDGSLYFNLSSENASLCSGTGMTVASTSSAKEIIFDGQDLSPKYTVPLIYMHRGVDEANRQNLVIEGVTFRNAKHRAILVQTNNLTRLRLDDCTFESTVREVQYGGGAIYIDVKTDAASDGTTNMVDVHRFELNNCTFRGNTAADGYGGAIAQFGNVHSGLINGCSFLNCETSGQGGGAISIAGGTGAMTFQKTTFSGCTSKVRGGAVEIRSARTISAENYDRWTRMNDISFTGCTFTNCLSTGSHGGAIAVKAQLNSLSVSGCSFSECTAGINGGAISLDGQDLPKEFGNTGVSNPNWCAALECDSCTSAYSTIGTTMTGSYDWGNKITSTNTIEKKSKIGTVTISDNCTFTNCSCDSNGGTIEFAEGCYIQNSATISKTTIDGGKALGGGSAIFLSNCFVNKLNLHNDIIKNCDFTEGGNDVGGTVRTTGNTTVVLDVQHCEFLKNHSYGHAGGLYWNAARTMEGVTCEATVNDCLFDSNSADMYGGALYVESKMTITKCHIKNNTATLMGGGIAQQVYNNPNVRMLDEYGVTELKLDPDTWIHNNEAEVGGGISIRANETDSIKDGEPIAYTVRFELNGAAVYQNTATKDGGGIYFIAESNPTNPEKQAEVDKYTKEILINAGTGTAAAVYNNTAGVNGGGIYMESSENTELRVEGGHISTNTAVNGGGIYMTGKNATCYVEGGTIGGEGNSSAGEPLANKAVRAEGATAGGNGGGIAISGGAKIEMAGGEVSYNDAAYQGGGIWLEDGSTDAFNSISVKAGQIVYNKVSASDATSANGGGVYVGKYNSAELTGGKISNNSTPGWGGGIYCGTGATATVSNGTISYNTAQCGAGIALQNLGTGTIEGGEICNNTAKTDGGGIYALHSSTVSVSGGSIHNNTATDGDGGGIDAEYSAQLNITGGSIHENTAGGAGGGISLQNSATATVTNDATNNTAGKITKNTAARGGGVAVESGAELTVENGFITYNKAMGKPEGLTTAYHLNDRLLGVGGGVYVAGAEADTTRASFTLTGDTIAIYGNLADFGADDVFTNGVKTKLEVPVVDQMELSGLGFKPEGWFEDYPINDANYLLGLALGTDRGITNGNVYRYKGSEATQRVEIEPKDNELPANGTDKYVCMTLGIGSGKLKISKTVDANNGTVDPNQYFLFQVESESFLYENHKAVNIKVMVKNGGSVVIRDLPYGYYKVTEITDWSTRYTPATSNPVTLVLIDAKTKETPYDIRFENKLTNDKWLSGDAYADNAFGQLTSKKEG